jgi:hypothetical protein
MPRTLVGDFVSFVKDVFHSWWMFATAVSAGLTLIGRIHDLGHWGRYVSPVFAIAATGCVVAAVFRVYRGQSDLIGDLQSRLNRQDSVRKISVEKLRGEVLYDIEHVNQAAVLQDDAFRTIEAEHLQHFTAAQREDLSDFYRDLRGLRESSKNWNEVNPSPTAMALRSEQRAQLREKGQKVAAWLSEAQRQ